MKNTFLMGNYAPIQDELDADNLSIEGKIPQDLQGVYMRNGPNPAFSPISYTYPFDGDGMIHAVYIENGKASYRNRYVKTKGLIAEQRAGKALYGGILQPIIPDPQLIGVDGDPGPFKNGAFIHIIRHANHYLAMWEGGPAYEVTKSLETLGEWSPKPTMTPINIGPHTRHCPISGELWLINYDIIPPYLSVYRINSQGVLLEKREVERPYCTMMHDFVLTANYLVFFVCPLVLNGKLLQSGNNGLQWRPELGAQIGVMSRKTGRIEWFDSEPFFVFHFANAYEEDKQIKVDYVRHHEVGFLTATKNIPQQSFFQTSIDLEKKTITHKKLDELHVEFPRIREEKNSLKHRYSYMPAKLAKEANNFHAMVKYDVKKGNSELHDFGYNYEIGEGVFAVSEKGNDEDDGYLMLFVYDRQKNNSQFVILDAKDIKAAPLAKIQMPRRIPHGLHGSWFTCL